MADPSASAQTKGSVASPTRALVTGSAGLVGRALVNELQASGAYETRALTRAHANLTDREQTNRAIAEARPDVVFHIAARVAGLGGNMAEPGAMFYDNVVINTNVVDAARLAGARKVVAIGSTAIYSDIVALPMSEDELWLGPPHASEASYGHAKRAMLAQLEAYKTQYGLDYAFCILTNTFGPNDRFDERYGHVMPSLISKFYRARQNGGPVTVWGTGTPRRDFMYSKDVARALRLVCERMSGPVNLASGREVSIRELTEIIRDTYGYKGEVVWDDSRPNGQELRSYDISRLRSIGFEPAWSLEQAVAETCDWFTRNIGDARR